MGVGVCVFFRFGAGRVGVRTKAQTVRTGLNLYRRVIAEDLCQNVKLISVNNGTLPFNFHRAIIPIFRDSSVMRIECSLKFSGPFGISAYTNNKITNQ